MNSNITSGFDMAAEIAHIAIEEFKAHYVTKNFTGLIQRYYALVEEDYGGMCFSPTNLNGYRSEENSTELSAWNSPTVYGWLDSPWLKYNVLAK